MDSHLSAGSQCWEHERQNLITWAAAQGTLLQSPVIRVRLIQREVTLTSDFPFLPAQFSKAGSWLFTYSKTCKCTEPSTTWRWPTSVLCHSSLHKDTQRLLLTELHPLIHTDRKMPVLDTFQRIKLCCYWLSQIYAMIFQVTDQKLFNAVYPSHKEVLSWAKISCGYLRSLWVRVQNSVLWIVTFLHSPFPTSPPFLFITLVQDI